jgi:hypothetical protein
MSAEIEEYRRTLQQADRVLRKVQTDRPTVHTPEVWEAILEVRERIGDLLDDVRADTPTPAEPAAMIDPSGKTAKRCQYFSTDQPGVGHCYWCAYGGLCPDEAAGSGIPTPEPQNLDLESGIPSPGDVSPISDHQTFSPYVVDIPPAML